MIKTYLVVSTLVITLLSSVIYAQVDSSYVTQNERSETIFRTLNDAGIKFKRARENAFKQIRQGERTEATNICDTFIKEIKDLRCSTSKIITLSRDDIRYLDKSLKRMQEDIEQLISDIPFMQLIPN